MLDENQANEAAIDFDSADVEFVGRRAAPAPVCAAAKHPSLVIALHWGTLAAILIAVGTMFLRDAIEDDAWRQILLVGHRQLGLLVMGAAVWRLVARLRKGLVDHAPDIAVVLRWAAKATHVALYGLLFALPLLGWACTSAHGISLTLLGVLPLPSLMAEDSEFADTLSDYHIWLSWILLGVAGVHALAGLWHHFVMRDAVLSAMLPGSSATEN